MDGATLDRLRALSERDLPRSEGRELIPGTVLSGRHFWDAGRRIALRVHTPGLHVPRHCRDFVELVYTVHGTGVHLLGSQRMELGPGELLLLGQNTPHEIPAQPGDILTVSFIIRPDFFGDILAFLGTDETPLREFVLKCLSQETPYGYLHFHVGDVKPVGNLIENLILHLLDQPHSRRAVPVLTVGLLFVQLLEESDRLTMGIREQQAVLKVLQYLEANYAGGSLTEAAKLLHCDAAWLSREIKRRTGRTYTELVQERRLQRAAWLLEHTRQRISDIALTVGYENVSYFHRIFQKRFSVSPKRYRDNC